MTDYRKNGSAVGGGGGMENPMTTVGDIVVGGTVSGGVADPARLGAGSSGYILRSVAGTPAWRELSAAGLGSARPNAVATREGQTYWSTDAAAGAELAMVIHKGGATYDWEILAYGAPGLPVATGAGEVPLSTGAGTTYAAANFGDEVSAIITDAIGGTAGQALIGDGAGDVGFTSADVSALLAAADAAAARAALGTPGGDVLAFGTGADIAWTDWALTSATNSGTSIVGGRVRIDTTADIDAAGGKATYTLPVALILGGFRLRARLATYTGADAGSRWGIAMPGGYGSPSGGYALVTDAGVVGTTAGADSPAAAIPIDGTGWLELVWRQGTLSVYVGVGTTTTPPTAWSLLRVGAPTLTGAGVAAADMTVVLFAQQYNAPGGTMRTEWDHVTLAPLGVGL